MGFRTKGKVDAGSKAPDFTLPSQSGEIVNLKGFVGSKPVVLLDLPRDHGHPNIEEQRSSKGGLGCQGQHRSTRHSSSERPSG
jgi:peroxiredoxin